jgi:hypothetical protein
LTGEPITHTHRRSAGARLLLILFLGVLLVAEGYFGYRLHTLSDQQKLVKEDYANINSIELGLFSVANWQGNVEDIVDHQVRNFKMTPAQKHDLQVEVQEIILALIDKAQAMINKPQTSLKGKIEKFAVKKFVNIDKIKAQVPDMAKTIMTKVDNPENKNKLSDMALSKFSNLQKTAYIASTTKTSDSLSSVLFSRYHVTTHEELNNKLISYLGPIRTETYRYSFAMLGCVIVVLMLWWILRKRVDLHATLFILSLLFAFILLFVGLTASMIEVDARIQTFDFMLLGEHVIFKDQVLFFQSKSILDVVRVLIKQHAADSIGVGVLILVFSILFPIMKLSSTGIHLLSKRKIAENKIIKYFAFQSGKWSMADVIVIAILMTYIGLTSPIENRLQTMNIAGGSALSVISTDNTALQPGYIIFICFVLYGLILSTILKSITPYDAH